MTLKRTLFYTFLKIFIITVCVVYSVGILFFNLCPEFKNESSAKPYFVLTDGERIVSKSKELDTFTANDIKMTASAENELYIIDNTHYLIKVSVADSGAKMLTLVPAISFTEELNLLFWVLLISFAISFLASLEYYKRKLSRDLVDQINRLSEEFFRLASGDLAEPVPESGDGEILALFRSLEELRIKLKDAIFYKKQIDENRSFLVSSISHDLKTPVTAVKGYLEGIIDGVADNDEKKTAYINKALEKTDLITVMIDDLLYFSKLDLHQIPFNLKRVNINKFIEYAVSDNLYAFSSAGKVISFCDNLKADSFVLIDEEKFQRVTQNVINNALKYTGDGGRLEIRLSQNSGSILIEFKDNGEGIAKHELSHIFDKFYRADSARKIEGSSGLGLAIAKQITEGLGGRIWAISEKGEGTSIMISLKKS